MLLFAVTAAHQPPLTITIHAIGTTRDSGTPLALKEMKTKT